MNRKSKIKAVFLSKTILVTAAVLALGACTSIAEKPPVNEVPVALDSKQAFSFVVMGDTPYSEEDKTMLKAAVTKVKDIKPPFVIHVGDTQSGGETCGADLDDRFAKLIRDMAPSPVYYTPGDNEWTDCDRQLIGNTGVRFSEIGRLNTLRDKFFAKPPAYSQNMNYAQLNVQPENASWTYNGIRFLTLHVPSTGNARTQILGDPELHAKQAAELRDSANLYWIKTQFRAASVDTYGKPLPSPAKAIVIAMQADMTGFEDDEQHLIGKPCLGVSDQWGINCDGFVALRAAIAKAAQGFSGPVLLIHGDTEYFTLNQEFLGSETANLWRLNAAGDVWFNKKTGDGGGFRDVTLVTVDLSNKQRPFSAVGLIDGTKPGS